ncbi:MAG: cohesin domain-containing protein, partial [Bacteroidota bacterium]
MKTKFLFLTFLMALGFLSRAHAQTIQVQAGTVQACGGDTVSVPINILNATNLGAISLSLNYNGGTLSFVGFSNAHPSLGSNLIVNATTQGNQPQVRVAWFNLVPINVNGLLMNMRFRATGNSTLVWDLQNAGNCELADSAANVINNVSFSNGGVGAAVAPAISQQPNPNVQALAGGAITLSVTASNAASYQWQRQSGSTWTNLTNGSGIAGATSASLQLTGITSALNNTVYRVQVNGACGAPLFSNASTLRVVTPIVTTIGSVAGCTGDTVSIPVSVDQLNGVAAISMAITYDSTKLQCLGMVSDVHPSINTSGFLSNCGIFPGLGRQFRVAWFDLNPVNISGLMFRVKFRVTGVPSSTPSTTVGWDLATVGNCEYADANADVIPYTQFVGGSVGIQAAATITAQPVANLTVPRNTPVSLAVSATNAQAFQWQRLVGTAWSNLSNGSGLSGVNTATLSIASADQSYNNASFRVVITGCSNPITSSVCSLRVRYGASDRISYQAVVRNAAGELVRNQAVGVRTALVRDSIAGATVYSETHALTTNANGLISFEFGGGLVATGSMLGLDWSDGPYFLRTEVDLTGSTNYQFLGGQQLLSVPFALYAASAGSVAGGSGLRQANSNGPSGNLPSPSAPGAMAYWNGSEWLTIAPGQNGQTLTFCQGVPTWGACPTTPNSNRRTRR